MISMDDINGTTTADSSGVSGSRYSLRSEKNKFLHGNDNHEEHSTIDQDDNGSNSSSDNDDPPLSEYELLRLRKIKRNEARLAQLGLLVPAAAAAAAASSKSSNNNAGETTTSSALTTLLLASPAQTSKKMKRKKKQDDTTITEPLPRRILPKRHCTTSRCSDDASDEESSVAASPILPKRILTLQPHQAAALDNNDNVTQCVPRRERRGRPRKEEFVYECDEVCGHCGGEWKLDGGEELEEETRLIR